MVYAVGALLAIATLATRASAQDLEPRAYANTPVGMNFAIVGYGYNEGNLLFDPAVPIQGAEATSDIALLAFARSFAIGGKSAKWAVVAPYAALDANGFVLGEYRERHVTGLADPTLAVTVNLYGAPAMAMQEFRRYRQDTIVGMTLKVTAPVGQYDDDKLLNIGTNRWSVKPEIGVSKAIGRWIVEGAAMLSWFESNDDFFGGKTLEQDVVYSLQAHVIYSHPTGWWTALDATYYRGGESTIDGVRGDNELNNWRIGWTATAPIDKNHSLKFAVSRGISTRTGTDFDAYSLAWQSRWGGGL